MHKLPATAFHRDDAVGAGFSASQVRQRVNSGEWAQLLPCVYAHCATPLTPAVWRRAALLWGGPTAALSGRTAGTMWGLDRVSETRPELIVVSNRRAPSSVIAHRCADLLPTDVVQRDGLRCTNPTRTVIDLAANLNDEALESAFESARRQNLTTVAAVRDRQRKLGTQGRRGSHRLLRILDALDGTAPAESPLEVLVARRLRDEPIPRSVRQHVVVIFGRTYRLDFAWPEFRLALECNGAAFHDFERDNRRWRQLGASGWRVLPVTWRDVTRNWPSIANELHAAFNRAAWAS
jgi:very-short-patch-repair endonuclease